MVEDVAVVHAHVAEVVELHHETHRPIASDDDGVLQAANGSGAALRSSTYA